MTHVFFDQDKIDWTPYLRQQQKGEGVIMEGRGEVDSGTARVFRGLRYTNGYGIVQNMLGSIGRFLMPIASNLAESAKKEAIGALGNVAAETAAGKPLLSTLTEEAKAVGNRLGEKLQQCGKGRKQRQRRPKTIVPSTPPPIIIPSNRKKRKVSDYLDFY